MANELLHDGGTESASGFGSSLSFLHRARRFFSFSKRERKEWGRKTFSAGARKEWVQKDASLDAVETGGIGSMRASTPTWCGGRSEVARCVGTAPRPSSVCFADTFPGGEGNPLRRGFGRTESSAPTGAVLEPHRRCLRKAMRRAQRPFGW